MHKVESICNICPYPPHYIEFQEKNFENTVLKEKMVKSFQRLSRNAMSNSRKSRTSTKNTRNPIKKHDGQEGKNHTHTTATILRCIFVFAVLWLISTFLFSRKMIVALTAYGDITSISTDRHSMNLNTGNMPIESMLPPALSLPVLSKNHLLTIAIDRKHGCPDACAFAHPIFPSWVQYRYLDFENEIDLNTVILEQEQESEEQDNSRRQGGDLNHHVLIIARTNIINIANWAVERRKTNRNSVSIGLWHMADERVYVGEIHKQYHKFDYVIRHYWKTTDEEGRLYGYPLHALGNYTCGSHKRHQHLPVIPPKTVNDNTTNGELGPTWGVHWAFLPSHGLNSLGQRSSNSIWPIHLRSQNCSFIGRTDVRRSKGERASMKQEISKKAPELNCQISFTKSFSGGNSKFHYYNDDLAKTKIGLCPRGSALETHRLTELLQTGTIPAIVDAEYLHAPFVDVPAIIGSNWSDIAYEMKELLTPTPQNLQKLEELSHRGSKFYTDLEKCMTSDMDMILRGAFDLS